MSGGGGTGMAGLVVTAVVAALIALAVSMLLPGAGPAPPAAPPAPPAPTDDLRAEVTRLRGEIAELRSSRKRGAASAGVPGASGPGPGAPPASPEAFGEPALPANRSELVALIDGRIAEKSGETIAAAREAVAEGKKAVSIEEAGAAIGLSAFEIDAVRRVYGDAENEMLAAVMGTTDLDAIRQEVRAAKDDPDKKAALVNKAVGNVFRNLGHVMTLEDRRDRELKKVLSEEKVKALQGYNLKPTFEDGELENLLEDVFEK